MRLDKYLADALSVTRSDIKKIIKQGKVSVNGVKALKPEMHVNQSDNVEVSGKTVDYQEYYYYMFYKPAGCVTANTDDKDRTVFEYLKAAKGKNLSAVGRLDKDTEGLLIITNDGNLNHQLMAPGKHVEKTYFCKLASELSDFDLEKLKSGINIGDEKDTMPAKCEKLTLENDMPGCLLTIMEGRFHQVKRMLNAVNNEVLYLKRISIGKLELDSNLLPGEFRELAEKEISMLLGE